MKVCMIITDGFEEAETLCPFDMLIRGGVEVDIYSLLSIVFLCEDEHIHPSTVLLGIFEKAAIFSAYTLPQVVPGVFPFGLV